MENTKQKILKAAIEIFSQKGYDGARMQEIADKAGINKAMIHYYFSTKKDLFQAVFKEIALKNISSIFNILKEDVDLEVKIKHIIRNYITFLKNNPELPLLLIKELNMHPDITVEIFSSVINSLDFNPFELLQKDLEKGFSEGLYRKVDAKELFINIISLCIFPIGAQAMIKKIFFNNNQESYDNFLENRILTLPEFILNAIKQKKDNYE